MDREQSSRNDMEQFSTKDRDQSSRKDRESSFRDKRERIGESSPKETELMKKGESYQTTISSDERESDSRNEAIEKENPEKDNAARSLDISSKIVEVPASNEEAKVVVKVCCLAGPGGREVRLGYRLAATGPMQKVINKVGSTVRFRFRKKYFWIWFSNYRIISYN